MAKTLVIGANGFIGSHLVDALAREGHEVSAFDRFSSGEPTFRAVGVRLIRGEFLSRADIDEAVAGQDYVLHLLSTTSPATAESDPTLDIRTNLAQSVELLEATARAGVKHFYYASTGGAIYGPQGLERYAETDRAMPLSPYGIGKLAIEHYLHYFKTRHGLASTSLRISNPYGTRQHPNRRQGLIPIALRNIIDGRPVVRFGDGSMVRDYVYVDDLVRMMVAFVGRETRFDLYNLGSGFGQSVTEILANLHEVTEVDFAIEERTTPPTFIDKVVLDTARWAAEFDPIELTPLGTGIRQTYEDMLARA